jgi:hypothetical protein
MGAAPPGWNDGCEMRPSSTWIRARARPTVPPHEQLATCPLLVKENVLFKTRSKPMKAIGRRRMLLAGILCSALVATVG